VGINGSILLPIINLLVCLAFVALLHTKVFKQDNTRIANILAIIFSLWLYIYQYIYAFIYRLNAFDSNIIGILYSFYATPLPSFGTLFVVGGIISTKYFSKYYGEIIKKFGIAILSIRALIEIFKIIGDIFYFPFLLTILSNVLIISFWFIYFKTLTSKTNVSFVSKNDPKDW